MTKYLISELPLCLVLSSAHCGYYLNQLHEVNAGMLLNVMEEVHMNTTVQQFGITFFERNEYYYLARMH